MNIADIRRNLIGVQAVPQLSLVFYLPLLEKKSGTTCAPFEFDPVDAITGGSF